MILLHWFMESCRTCEIETASTAFSPNPRAEEAITTRRGVIRPVVDHFINEVKRILDYNGNYNSISHNGFLKIANAVRLKVVQTVGVETIFIFNSTRSWYRSRAYVCISNSSGTLSYFVCARQPPPNQ
jgi:hypothetical protein